MCARHSRHRHEPWRRWNLDHEHRTALGTLVPNGASIDPGELVHDVESEPDSLRASDPSMKVSSPATILV
jgi:hypothetical protein